MVVGEVALCADHEASVVRQMDAGDEETKKEGWRKLQHVCRAEVVGGRRGTGTFSLAPPFALLVEIL